MHIYGDKEGCEKVVRALNVLEETPFGRCVAHLMKEDMRRNNFFIVALPSQGIRSSTNSKVVNRGFFVEMVFDTEELVKQGVSLGESRGIYRGVAVCAQNSLSGVEMDLLHELTGHYWRTSTAADWVTPLSELSRAERYEIAWRTEKLYFHFTGPNPHAEGSWQARMHEIIRENVFDPIKTGYSVTQHPEELAAFIAEFKGKNPGILEVAAPELDTWFTRYVELREPVLLPPSPVIEKIPVISKANVEFRGVIAGPGGGSGGSGPGGSARTIEVTPKVLSVETQPLRTSRIKSKHTGLWIGLAIALAYEVGNAREAEGLDHVFEGKNWFTKYVVCPFVDGLDSLRPSNLLLDPRHQRAVIRGMVRAGIGTIRGLVDPASLLPITDDFKNNRGEVLRGYRGPAFLPGSGMACGSEFSPLPCGFSMLRSDSMTPIIEMRSGANQAWDYLTQLIETGCLYIHDRYNEKCQPFIDRLAEGLEKFRDKHHAELLSQTMRTKSPQEQAEYLLNLFTNTQNGLAGFFYEMGINQKELPPSIFEPEVQKEFLKKLQTLETESSSISEEKAIRLQRLVNTAKAMKDGAGGKNLNREQLQQLVDEAEKIMPSAEEVEKNRSAAERLKEKAAEKESIKKALATTTKMAHQLSEAIHTWASWAQADKQRSQEGAIIRRNFKEMMGALGIELKLKSFYDQPIYTIRERITTALQQSQNDHIDSLLQVAEIYQKELNAIRVNIAACKKEGQSVSEQNASLDRLCLALIAYQKSEEKFYKKVSKILRVLNTIYDGAAVVGTVLSAIPVTSVAGGILEAAAALGKLHTGAHRMINDSQWNRLNKHVSNNQQKVGKGQQRLERAWSCLQGWKDALGQQRHQQRMFLANNAHLFTPRIYQINLQSEIKNLEKEISGLSKKHTNADNAIKAAEDSITNQLPDLGRAIRRFNDKTGKPRKEREKRTNAYTKLTTERSGFASTHAEKTVEKAGLEGQIDSAQADLEFFRARAETVAQQPPHHTEEAEQMSSQELFDSCKAYQVQLSSRKKLLENSLKDCTDPKERVRIQGRINSTNQEMVREIIFAADISRELSMEGWTPTNVDAPGHWAQAQFEGYFILANLTQERDKEINNLPKKEDVEAETALKKSVDRLFDTYKALENTFKETPCASKETVKKAEEQLKQKIDALPEKEREYITTGAVDSKFLRQQEEKKTPFWEAWQLSLHIKDVLKPKLEEEETTRQRGLDEAKQKLQDAEFEYAVKVGSRRSVEMAIRGFSQAIGNQQHFLQQSMMQCLSGMSKQDAILAFNTFESLMTTELKKPDFDAGKRQILEDNFRFARLQRTQFVLSLVREAWEEATSEEKMSLYASLFADVNTQMNTISTDLGKVENELATCTDPKRKNELEAEQERLQRAQKQQNHMRSWLIIGNYSTVMDQRLILLTGKSEDPVIRAFLGKYQEHLQEYAKEHPMATLQPFFEEMQTFVRAYSQTDGPGAAWLRSHTPTIEKTEEVTRSIMQLWTKVDLLFEACMALLPLKKAIQDYQGDANYWTVVKTLGICGMINSFGTPVVGVAIAMTHVATALGFLKTEKPSSLDEKFTAFYREFKTSYQPQLDAIGGMLAEQMQMLEQGFDKVHNDAQTNLSSELDEQHQTKLLGWKKVLESDLRLYSGTNEEKFIDTVDHALKDSASPDYNGKDLAGKMGGNIPHNWAIVHPEQYTGWLAMELSEEKEMHPERSLYLLRLTAKNFLEYVKGFRESQSLCDIANKLKEHLLEGVSLTVCTGNRCRKAVVDLQKLRHQLTERVNASANASRAALQEQIHSFLNTEQAAACIEELTSGNSKWLTKRLAASKSHVITARKAAHAGEIYSMKVGSLMITFGAGLYAITGDRLGLPVAIMGALAPLLYDNLDSIAQHRYAKISNEELERITDPMQASPLLQEFDSVPVYVKMQEQVLAGYKQLSIDLQQKQEISNRRLADYLKAYETLAPIGGKGLLPLVLPAETIAACKELENSKFVDIELLGTRKVIPTYELVNAKEGWAINVVFQSQEQGEMTSLCRFFVTGVDSVTKQSLQTHASSALHPLFKGVVYTLYCGAYCVGLPGKGTYQFANGKDLLSIDHRHGGMYASMQANPYASHSFVSDGFDGADSRQLTLGTLNGHWTPEGMQLLQRARSENALYLNSLKVGSGWQAYEANRRLTFSSAMLSYKANSKDLENYLAQYLPQLDGLNLHQIMALNPLEKHASDFVNRCGQLFKPSDTVLELIKYIESLDTI